MTQPSLFTGAQLLAGGWPRPSESGRLPAGDQTMNGKRTHISALEYRPSALLPPPPARTTVYALEAFGLMKIGYTSDLENRIDSLSKELQAQHGLSEPVQLALFMALSFPGRIGRHVETWFHLQLADRRKAGEWFDVAPEDLRDLKRPARYYARYVERCIQTGRQIDDRATRPARATLKP